MTDGWIIAESPFCVATAKAYEGLFAQGSGYLQVRGSLEEHLSDTPQNVSYMRMPANVTSEKFPETKAKWGTYVPGVYGKHPLLNWELVNLPYFLELVPVISGERLDLEKSRVDDYSRELDMSTGTLWRSFIWHTRDAGDVKVNFERFVSAARPHMCFQRLTLECVESASVNIAAGIDADVRTNGYDHFTSVTLKSAESDGVRCCVTTDGDDEVRMVSRLMASNVDWHYVEEPRSARLVGETTVPAGGKLVIEKRTAVTSSRDLEHLDADHLLAEVASLSYDDLHREHAAVWKDRWDRSDVVIEGDPVAQMAMRCSIYHLLRSHVPDDRVAIDAKGYAGDAYFGRFFWDTEMYLLPFFLYTDPQKARTFVDFRVQSLPGARETAASYGYSGARYPWESDSQGRDCCPSWQYRDHEIHVTADVAYGMAHYAAGVPDPSYLSGPAAEVIVETARYWMQRIDCRDGSPCLLGVMGPDEYSPITNNNSYTNRLVSLNLALAAEVGEKIGVSPKECAAFAETAAKLQVLRTEDGFVLQCEGFDQFAEPCFDELWKDRKKTFAAQVSQERLYRSKCLKQGDVIMLMALFPREFTDDEVRRAWDYYLPYTTHDSSLSAGAHALVACRLGLDDEAWSFWQMSSGLDLDIEHGAVGEGIHIAAAGANWQIAVMGFAGMATAMDSDVLSLRPRLPEKWTRLAFPVVWKGCPVYIDITKDRCTVANRGAAELNVLISGKSFAVAPGGQIESEI